MTSTDAQLDRALRSLDVADRDLGPGQAARKDALLSTLLAEGPVSDLGGGRRTRDGRRPERGGRPDHGGRRRAARWLIPAAAAAGLATVFAVTGGPGGVGGSTAYASWSATPQPVDAATRATAEQACRDGLRGSLSSMSQDVPADQRPTTDPGAIRTVVAEKRGNFLFLAMSAPDGSTQQCFFGADDPSQVDGATGALVTKDSAVPAALMPGQIEWWGGGRSSGPEGTYAFTTGRVGPGVTAVTIRTAGQSIQATVTGGSFAAWWPAAQTPPNAPGPAEAYDLTLADGRVVKDAPNAGDQGRQAGQGAQVEPGARQVAAITQGGGASEGGPRFVTVSGRAGVDVTAVTVHAGGRSATATLQDGAFTAELPEGTDTAAATFDLTLKDGTVLRGQKPAASGR
ncbi:hypothetical protein [Arsenicicoccus bolidensis]|uniref:DUF4179 domain-containing protein n=1 Tax=Arsenicicoccus bolidensis TaxID=229480 RepID=A0ABS9Q4R5_9MICO|nr:hypothetical protein [Arsenicicoccus bolidensis]MCG7322864.1 hypothetical protein [Arsenicicoccus bolidensis]